MFSIFAISDKLDAITCIGNLANVNFVKIEQITRTHFFLLQPAIRPILVHCGKGRQNFASKVLSVLSFEKMISDL